MTSDRGRRDDDGVWAAFEAEALPHLDRLFRLAMWFERDRAEAEDLVQETLKEALASFHRFKAGTNCRAWLVSILQHVRGNRQRAKSRSLFIDDPEELAARTVPFTPPVPQELTDEDVLAALGRLPAHYQGVIVLCDVEELSYKEIAAALNEAPGTSRAQLSRARARLRELLADVAKEWGL